MVPSPVGRERVPQGGEGYHPGIKGEVSRFDFTGSELEMETSYGPAPEQDEKQMGLALAESRRDYKSANLRGCVRSHCRSSLPRCAYDVGFCSYGTERMRQKLLVVATGGLVKVKTPLMLMVFVS